MKLMINIKGRFNKLVDSEGKTIKFANMAAIINYVCCHGWEFVTDFKAEEKTGKTEFLFRKKE